MIYTIQGYLENHTIYTKFVIVINFLLLYYIIKNITITRSIILRDFMIKDLFISLHIL